MTTNFFQNIAALQLKGCLTITIAPDKNNGLVVSVLLNNKNAGDDAKVIPAMIFRQTAQKLDECFFEGLTKPAQETDELLSNMENYQKALEQARKAKQPNKDSDTKPKDEKTKNMKPKCRK